MDMQVLDSVVDGALAMPDRAQGDALIAAAVRFLRSGEEPEGLDGYALASWLMVRPALENSRARALAGRSGSPRGSASGGRGREAGSGPGSETDGKTGNGTESKPGNKATNKTANKPDSKAGNKPGSKATNKTDSKPDSKRGNYQDSSSYSYSQITEEGVQGEGEPPSADEVRGFFEANCLRGDPDDFWLHFESQGWVTGSGRPIANWRARALKWSRDQVSRDAERAAERAARGEPDPADAVWRPAAGLDPDAELARAEAEYARRFGGEAA